MHSHGTIVPALRNESAFQSVTILISYLVGLKGCRVGIVIEVVN